MNSPEFIGSRAGDQGQRTGPDCEVIEGRLYFNI